MDQYKDVIMNYEMQTVKEELNATKAALRNAVEERLQIQHSLKERMKELDCLYSISKLTEQEPDTALDNLLQEVVNLIPSAWRYPEITCARIIVGNKKYKTKNFKPTE